MEIIYFFLIEVSIYLKEFKGDILVIKIWV